MDQAIPKCSHYLRDSKTGPRAVFLSATALAVLEEVKTKRYRYIFLGRRPKSRSHFIMACALAPDPEEGEHEEPAPLILFSDE